MNTPPSPASTRESLGSSSETHEHLTSKEEAYRWLLAGHDVCLVLPAPLTTPELLVSHPPVSVDAALLPRVFWHECDEDGLRETNVGFGSFAEFTDAWGRTEELGARAQPVLQALKRTGAPARVTPRVFAAVGFSERREPSVGANAVWADFDAAFGCLPRLTYVRRAPFETSGDQAEAYWLLCLEPRDVPTLDRWLTALHHYGRRMAASRAPETVPIGVPARSAATSRESWRAWVSEALADIRHRRLDKVVAARFERLGFDTAVSPGHTLLALSETHPSSTRFAFFRGVSVFLGATPERLVARDGSIIRTAALAGTVWPEEKIAEPHAASREAAAPNTSGKDFSAEHAAEGFGAKEYSEHSPVLANILRALTPLCLHLSHDSAPTVRAQRGVFHLRTAVRGELAAPTHVLTLVQRLHPTPAVGGDPASKALEWIARHENFERGLYAGPIGWFDVDGNGHFDVALRCGVVTASELTLFAGAGIVEGSDPEREFVETTKKMQVLLGSVCQYPAPTEDR